MYEYHETYMFLFKFLFGVLGSLFGLYGVFVGLLGRIFSIITELYSKQEVFRWRYQKGKAKA